MPVYLYDETVERLKGSRFSTMSEYIRDLIRKDEWAERFLAHDDGLLKHKTIEFTPANKF